jgi:hypothetical protein
LVPDESTQYRDNSALVATGVLHQALERVDATEPNLDGVRAKVCDGCGITVGELSLLCDPQLNIRRHL